LAGLVLLGRGPAAVGQTLGDATDAPELVWTEDSNYAIYTNNTHWHYSGSSGYEPKHTWDGVAAANVNGFMYLSYANNLNAWMETTVEGPGVLTFRWRASSELNYDFLHFAIDGSEKAAISGESGWLPGRYVMASGTHMLRWTYTKDGSVNNNNDAGYVDQVHYVPDHGTVDHFVWSPITSPKNAGLPFPATLSGIDVFGNVATNFTGPVFFEASCGVPQLTNMLGNMVSSQYEYAGTNMVGYTFTPSTNLFVTHVRHQSGSKVLIWKDTGELLVSQPVSSLLEYWRETPLAAPLLLAAGTSYRIGVYSAFNVSGPILLQSASPSTFAYGTLGANYNGNGDAFPTNDFSTYRALVDLRFVVGNSSTVSTLPAGSVQMVNGVWAGSVTVSGASSNVVLVAQDNDAHTGFSNPFTVGTDGLFFSPGAPHFSREGGFQCDLSGPTNRTITIQVSTNLVNWDFLRTLDNPSGAVHFADSMTNQARRYYRAWLP
jgi:hypothetical protein